MKPPCIFNGILALGRNSKLKRKVVRIIRGILIIAFTLICSLFLFLLAVWIWPKILINETVLRYVAKIVAQKGVVISWNEIFIDARSQSFFKKELDLQARNICFHWIPENLQGCSSEISFSLSARFKKWKLALVELGPLSVKNLKWSLALAQQKKISGWIELKTTDAQIRELQPLENWGVRISAQIFLPDHSRAKIQGSLHLGQSPVSNYEIGYQLLGTYFRSKATAIVRLNGVASTTLFRGRISGEGFQWIKEIPNFSVQDCNFELNKQIVENFQWPALFSFQCKAQLRTNLVPKTYQLLRIPSFFEVGINSKIQLSKFIPSSNMDIQGDVHLTAEPLFSPLVQASLNLKSSIAGLISEFPNHWRIQPFLNLSINIPFFERLVESLKYTPWAVPAPFAILKGSIIAHFNGQADLHGAKIPFQLQSRLHSKSQNLDLDSTGVFEFDWSRHGRNIQSKLIGNVSLTQIKLELPNFDVGPLPTLFPNSKFQPTQIFSRKKEEPKKTYFKYQFILRTLPKNPIKILSNLALAPIPVEMDLKFLNDQPLSGNIKINRFPIEVFRRKARLDFLSLHLQSPADYSTLNGMIWVDYADYKIGVRITDTLAKPQIHLSSEPPLPENQLFSVLLFGHPLNELDTDQRVSVANTRAAFSSGAMNLASFYLLASTPVESISYDPTTQSVLAKVKLGEGTSLNLGANSQESTTIGIRKRLGNAWTIMTDVNNAPDTGSVFSAYLEWSLRY